MPLNPLKEESPEYASPEEQHQQQLEQQGVAFAHDGAQRGEGAIDNVLINLSETDLDKSVYDRLKVLLSRDIPMANFTEAETWEKKWYPLAIECIFTAMHPPKESFFQGEVRMALSEDPTDDHVALSEKDRLEIRTLTEIVGDRATRGRGGFEWKEVNTSYAISEVNRRDESADESSGWGWGK